MSSVPYSQYLDVAETLALEATVHDFDLTKAMAGLYAFDHPGSTHKQPTANEIEAHLDVARRAFAAQTESDLVLKSFLSTEREPLQRAKSIDGKLSLLFPPLSKHNTLLAAILAHLGPAIWQ